jgi:hypothetical protein
MTTLSDIDLRYCDIAELRNFLYDQLPVADKHQMDEFLFQYKPAKRDLFLLNMLDNPELSKGLKTAMAWRFSAYRISLLWLLENQSEPLLSRSIRSGWIQSNHRAALARNNHLTIDTILTVSKHCEMGFQDFMLALPTSVLSPEILTAIIQKRQYLLITDDTLLTLIRKVSPPEERELPDEWLLKVNL